MPIRSGMAKRTGVDGTTSRAPPLRPALEITTNHRLRWAVPRRRAYRAGGGDRNRGAAAVKSLTLADVERVLRERAGGVLKCGQHLPYPANGKYDVCARELRALALGLPWTDHPDGEYNSPTDCVSQLLNDACWSNDEARTRTCLPLVLLSEATAAFGWAARYVERIVRELVPLARHANDDARSLADEATVAMASGALTQAVRSATLAARAAAGFGQINEEILSRAVNILIECQRGDD